MSDSFPRRILASRQAMLCQLKRYSLTLVLVAIAIALRTWLTPLMGQQSIAVFLAAVITSAWFGGVGPALVSLVLLHIVHGFWFSEPKGLLQLNLASVVTTAAYYLVGIAIGALSQLRAAAVRREREQQQEAFSQREHLRTILSCMADGVLVTDVDGKLTLMNPAAERMTGWKLAEAIGKPWSEVFPLRRDDAPDKIDCPIDRVLLDGGVVNETLSITLTSRLGKALPIAYSAAPVQDLASQTRGAVLIFRDESERRRIVLALRNADRSKDEFLATLAHELRNPLAPISTGLELMDLSLDDPTVLRELSAMMKRQTRHMVRLVDDLLDVSRITRGRLELRRGDVDLRDVISGAVEAARPLIAESEHQLAVSVPENEIRLHADANRLTQVFTNLLNNAAKYTPRGGQIAVAATKSAGEVVVTIADSGIGVPTDKLDRIFDMFAQINESSEHGHTGLGIGLTLVKRLVEMHGGNVEAQSAGRNLGTTFHVRLPLLPAAPQPSNDSPQRRPGTQELQQRRVLIVDDNADALDSLSLLVKSMGNEVRVAHNGLEAIEVARRFQPEIVLMDLGMPVLNGYEAAERMRREPWGANIAIVATTGWGQEEDRRRTADAGFNGHLVKPIELESLREVLAAAPALLG